MTPRLFTSGEGETEELLIVRSFFYFGLCFNENSDITLFFQ